LLTILEQHEQEHPFTVQTMDDPTPTERWEHWYR
jgi:hypothetical protein